MVDFTRSPNEIKWQILDVYTEMNNYISEIMEEKAEDGYKLMTFDEVMGANRMLRKVMDAILGDPLEEEASDDNGGKD